MYKSNSAYDRLCAAVRSRNETGIVKAANDLTVRGIVKDSEIIDHYNRVSTKLEKLSGILSFKNRMFNHPAERRGQNANLSSSVLWEEIGVLTEDVRILKRIQTVVGNEYSRRGIESGTMREERHYVVQEKVTA